MTDEMWNAFVSLENEIESQELNSTTDEEGERLRLLLEHCEKLSKVLHSAEALIEKLSAQPVVTAPTSQQLQMWREDLSELELQQVSPQVKVSIEQIKEHLRQWDK